MNTPESNGNLAQFFQQVQKFPAAEYIEKSARESLLNSVNLFSTTLNTVQPEPIYWLWKYLFALGKLAIISGDPGGGKSQLTCYMAACTTTGAPFHGELMPRQPASVIMVAGEDDTADTVVPRLKAAGADLSKVSSIHPVIKGNKPRTFDIVNDLDRIEDLVKFQGDCKLLIIDPISAFLGNVDSNSNSDVRAALSPLTDLAQRYKFAVICVSHLNKATGTKAMYRTMGSLAFVAAARTAFATARDANNEEVRYLCELKNNIAKNNKPIAYSIAFSKEHQAPYIVFSNEAVNLTTEKILNPQEQSAKSDEYIDFIRSVLCDGPLSVDCIREECDKAGYSFRTIEKYKRAAGVESTRPGGKGAWKWELKS